MYRLAAGLSRIGKIVIYTYDAILLDVGLPRLDGFSEVESVRKATQTPVLLLLAGDDPALRVRALDCGADGCSVKPFDLLELPARLRAIIRRAAGQAHTSISLGDVLIDTRAHSIKRAGKAVALTAREYAIVEYLALPRGELVTRTALYEHVFDESDHTLSNPLDVHIFSIRKKLGSRFVITRWGQGFSVEA